MKLLFSLFTATLLLPAPARCWWETGHRVVARLAAAHLTPPARTRIARILNVADSPEAVADALAVASTWADETKAATKTGAWHFIDLALQDSRANIPERCPHDDCVTARIHSFAMQLAAPTPSTSASQLDALRYVVHLVGDLHQPLHAVSDADLGGNCEHVDPPVETATNLHAVWDGAIVSRLGRSDRELAAGLDRNLQSSSQSSRTALAAGSENDWAWESHQLAIADVYQKLSIPTEPVLFPHSCPEAPLAVSNLTLHLSADYLEAMEPVVREQLTKAGLRLARLLNETL